MILNVLTVLTPATTLKYILSPGYEVKEGKPTEISWIQYEDGSETGKVKIRFADGTIIVFYDFDSELFTGVQDAIENGDICRFFYWVEVEEYM
jgi:hypothetical protein